MNFHVFLDMHSHVGTRGHRDKLYPKTMSTERSLCSFPHRVVNNWNKLPDVVVASKSLVSFKTNLDNHVHLLVTLLRGGHSKTSSKFACIGIYIYIYTFFLINFYVIPEVIHNLGSNIQRILVSLNAENHFSNEDDIDVDKFMIFARKKLSFLI